jgi:hypothetical protein
MKESLWVIGLDATGVVLEVRLLRPRRFVKVPEATWVLELTAAAMPPPIGSVLSAGSG